ncbi:MAG TPA: glycoside hydrolase family 43 protein, partial [Pyrinomonadaceae bacterium]
MQDSHGRLATYLNPVYSRSFPDPFILKFRGEYFAYSTGFAPDGKVFMTLRSSDLVTWTEIGGAMTPLPDSPPFYWAPEVSYSNGKFYLYYSVGNETFMEIRLAISGRPDGGFTDSGTKLTSEDFAIDAHVFLDQDGTRYFFYATDFLEHSHIGTGTVVDRMVDWKTLEGNSHPVTRAKYDWQVYDHNRKEKGGVRWHTVEGPAVLKRKGLYYEMFSGGNWQNTTYGVSFAIADSLERGDEWAQFSDGVNVLPVLRTIPGVVDGPGHNSVVRGPNNRELYCVYHRWVDGARVLAIDRMDFAGDRIFVVGPTNAPQPLPLPPSIRERFIGRISSDRIAIRGDWRFDKQGIVSVADGRCEMRLETISQSFLLELTLAFSDIAAAGGDAGVIFETASASATINLDLTRRSVEIASNATSRTFDFPPELDWTADHFVRIECDHRWFRIKVDDLIVCPWSMLEAPVDRITIFSENSPLMMGSLELTEGFEELFEDDTALEDNGWSFQSGGNYQRAPGEIRFHERDFR